MTTATELAFEATRSSGSVSAILLRPADADCLYVLGHGAGAGMRHRFLEAIAQGLAAVRVATLRYQFPYLEQGSKRPNPHPVLKKTVRSAVAKATELSDGLPLFAGGKSMGGRMTSLAAADEPLPGVRGIVFLGFPLHAPGRDPAGRGDHLADVTVPMLFLQGTRDRLADLSLLRPVCAVLPRATLHEVEGGDHSFGVLKRSGRTEVEVFEELVSTVREWVDRVR